MDLIGANVLVSGLRRDMEYRLPMVADLDVDAVNVASDSAEEQMKVFIDGHGFDVVFDATAPYRRRRRDR